MPRPLNSDERAVLLAQADRAEVVAAWAPGSVSVDLTVPDAVPDGELNGVFPRRAWVADVGEILAWVSWGALSGLEYAW
ncbi:hypothetical protein [Amycolatopsis rubida]|uniref:Uncharacterized protein n=1 Tax=Amycolatopsis rubida TaxID=112413 RepID=A0A1I5Z947_9PSEU|nr:hypothetical protein [Amycolatopsis rubida]SFQ52983.1 hypothetical protein SAMN05421854_114103 [Amycolatopsis rubida]